MSPKRFGKRSTSRWRRRKPRCEKKWPSPSLEGGSSLSARRPNPRACRDRNSRKPSPNAAWNGRTTRWNSIAIWLGPKAGFNPNTELQDFSPRASRKAEEPALLMPRPAWTGKSGRASAPLEARSEERPSTEKNISARDGAWPMVSSRMRNLGPIWPMRRFCPLIARLMRTWAECPDGVFMVGFVLVLSAARRRCASLKWRVVGIRIKAVYNQLRAFLCPATNIERQAAREFPCLRYHRLLCQEFPPPFGISFSTLFIL